MPTQHPPATTLVVHLLLLVLLLATHPAQVRATLPKANEYKSADCSGDASYPHWDAWLTMVTMDDTTRCVYLALPDWSERTWQAFGEKTDDGGHCWGEVLGMLRPGAVNLDDEYPGKRICCVLNCATEGQVGPGGGGDVTDGCYMEKGYVAEEDAGVREDEGEDESDDDGWGFISSGSSAKVRRG